VNVYMQGAHENCVKTGRCQYRAKIQEAQGLVDAAAAMIGGIKKMSQALWCDHGEHAFSERDPGRKRVQETTLVDGEERYQTADVCGPCNREVEATREAVRARRAELTHRVSDAEVIDAA